MSLPGLKSPVCELCSGQFSNMETLAIHIKIAHDETLHMKIERQSHMVSEALTKESRDIKTNSPHTQKSIDCSECGLIFTKHEEMQKHNNEHHKNAGKFVTVLQKSSNCDTSSEYEEKIWTDHKKEVQGVTFTGKARAFENAFTKVKELLMKKGETSVVNDTSVEHARSKNIPYGTEIELNLQKANKIGGA